MSVMRMRFRPKLVLDDDDRGHDVDYELPGIVAKAVLCRGAFIKEARAEPRVVDDIDLYEHPVTARVPTNSQSHPIQTATWRGSGSGVERGEVITTGS